MTQNTIYLSVLIALPLIAQLRSWPPYSLFAITTAAYAFIAAISFAQIKVFLHQVEQSEPAYHDTYYVTFAGNYATGFVLVLALFAAITYAQTRYGAMLYPNTTKALFWVLHIALLASVTATTMLAYFLSPLLGSDFEQPRRYIDYQTYFERINSFSTWAGYIAISASLLLFTMAIWSAIRAWRS